MNKYKEMSTISKIFNSFFLPWVSLIHQNMTDCYKESLWPLDQANTWYTDNNGLSKYKHIKYLKAKWCLHDQ